MERILGDRLYKVKVARLFLVAIAELFIDCDYFATGGNGVCPVMRDQKGRQLPLPDPPDPPTTGSSNESPKLANRGADGRTMSGRRAVM